MNKNITAAISAAAIVAAIGVCGGIECGTVSFGAGMLACVVLCAVSVIAGRAAYVAARMDDEAALRREAREAREARRACRSVSGASRPRVETVRLAHF